MADRETRQLRTRTRPSVAPPRDPHLSTKWHQLKTMPCWDEVEQQLRLGTPVAQIVQWVQEVKQEYTHVTPESLRVMLFEYRREMDPLGTVVEHMPDVAAKALAALEEGVDEVDELGKLYRLQIERVQAGRKLEAGMGGFLNTNVDKAIHQAVQILLKRAELKLKLGVGKGQAPGADKSRVVAKYGPGIREVMENDASRGKVISLARAVAKLRGYDPDDIDEAYDAVAGEE